MCGSEPTISSRTHVDGDDPPAAAVASGEGVAGVALDAVADERRGVGRQAGLGLKQQEVARHGLIRNRV
jgi:hypothetical protein